MIKVLIDGYNLIFECGLYGKRVRSDSLARARKKLLQTIVKSVATDQLRTITVVFDAKKMMLSGQQEQDRFEGIQILYAINHEDADAMIEQLILQHSAPKQLTVVSSDHRLHKAALRRKARPMDSGQWYDDLLAGRIRRPSIENPSTDDIANPPDSLLTEADLDLLKDSVERDELDDVDDWFTF